MPKPPSPIDESTFVGQVAAEVRRRRLKKYPRAQDAAKAAKVPQATWYRWESGEVTLASLPIIAKALGCRPRQLLPA